MKNFKILLLVSLLLVTANSCKKDYPKDIPDWLKDKIKALNKDSKGKGCENEECRYIWEYTDGTNTIFLHELAVTNNSDTSKKDYPKDIPDWLKDKIKALNKDSKGKGCENEECRYIWEYTDGTNTIFLYRPSPDYTPTTYLVYDYDGNERCVYQPFDSSSCQILNINSYYFKRKIWTET